MRGRTKDGCDVQATTRVAKKPSSPTWQAFISSWGEIQEACHESSVRHGFWPKDKASRNDAESIALMHSELSEALESLRSTKGGILKSSSILKGIYEVEEELADVVIRMMDYAGGRNFRIAEAILAKMKYNEQRGYKHGREF